MKPKYTPLSKLTDKLKNYKVKVKVIQKGPPRQTPPKPCYQKLTLKDDEGNTMQATIFGDDIEVYADAIQRNGEYELSDAPIKAVPSQYRDQVGEFQMNFNGRMQIKPLNLLQCTSEPQYRSLSLVPRTYSDGDELVDVLGVVIFISKTRTVSRNNVEHTVRDIYIADDSVQRPMKLSAWNQFAVSDADSIASWTYGFVVVGFTGLRPVTTRGLGLTTALSTSFIPAPTGSKADALRFWANDNNQQLRRWQEKCISLNSEEASKNIVPLETIEAIKAATLWQEEKFWVKAKMYHLTPGDVYTYIGCSTCSRRVDNELGATFRCYHCGAENSTASVRVTLKPTISDLTGSTRVTAFGSLAEQMLGIKGDEIHALKLNDDGNVLDDKLTELSQKEMLIHISPTFDLSLSNSLKWVVRAIEDVQKQDLDDLSHPAAETPSQIQSSFDATAITVRETSTQLKNEKGHGKTPQKESSIFSEDVGDESDQDSAALGATAYSSPGTSIHPNTEKARGKLPRKETPTFSGDNAKESDQDSDA